MNIIYYVINKIYSLLSADHRAKKRQEKYEQMRNSGELEGLTTSEIEEKLGLRKIEKGLPWTLISDHTH